MVNLGCTHLKWAYNHCAEMNCVNYVSKCPLHSMSGSSTAICNLDRAMGLAGLTDETRNTIVATIALSPALEEAILVIASLAYQDGADSVTDLL